MRVTGIVLSASRCWTVGVSWGTKAGLHWLRTCEGATLATGGARKGARTNEGPGGKLVVVVVNSSTVGCGCLRPSTLVVLPGFDGKCEGETTVFFFFEK